MCAISKNAHIFACFGSSRTAAPLHSQRVKAARKCDDVGGGGVLGVKIPPLN